MDDCIVHIKEPVLQQVHIESPAVKLVKVGTPGTRGLPGPNQVTPQVFINAQYSVNGLFRNGSCQSGDTSNFTAATYGAANISAAGSNGFFKFVGAHNDGQEQFSDDFIYLDANSLWELTCDVKQLHREVGSAGIVAFGIAEYDFDGNLVLSPNVNRVGDTTLAAPLNNGDTTIILSSAAGWDNSSGDWAKKLIAFYPYADSTGFVYDRALLPYTRNTAIDLAGLWADGGIVGNTVNLLKPWSFGNYPAGQQISNAYGGSLYNYCLAMIIQPPADRWARLRAVIGGGTNLSGAPDITYFRPGMRRIKLVLYANYGGAALDEVGVTNINIQRVPMTRTQAGLS